MSKHNVNEVAKMFDVSTATIYKKTKKLKDRLAGMTTREKGVIYFSPEAVEVIRQEITTAPKETVLSPTLTTAGEITMVISRFGDMEKAMLSMAEQMKAMVDENRALRSEVSSLQNRIEYKPTAAAQHPAEAVTRMNPQREKPPARSAPKVQSQNPELSLWESVRLYFDDLSGFFLGKG